MRTTQGVRTKRTTQRRPMKRDPNNPMKKNPMKTMQKKLMNMKPMNGVVVGTALTGKQTKTNNNDKLVHVDSRYVKEIWAQVEVVQNMALVKVWKKDD